MVETSVAVGRTLRVDDLMLRFLGLQLETNGDERYEVCFHSPDAAWKHGQLSYEGASSWALVDDHQASCRTLVLGLPNEVFALASGLAELALEDVARSVPHWPSVLHDRLARRRASGACTVAFDGTWFLSRLVGTPIDRPLLFPHAAEMLGLSGVVRAAQVVAAAFPQEDSSLIDVLLGALQTGSSWTGEGRLIGESTWGDLCQVADDITAGCEAAEGRGLLRVVFDPDERMGLGFGPEVPSSEVVAGIAPASGASAGTGAEVGVVEPGGVADAAGVTEGMVVTGLAGLVIDGATLPFEEVLASIDARRDAGQSVGMVFDTAAPLRRWYAVEMPAAGTLAALGALSDQAYDEVDVGESMQALCRGALLWNEPIPRLFLGAAGSVTCAHVDICPQVQLAHGMLGTKILGVASHAATPGLVAKHCGDEGHGSIDEGATHVPTHRAPTERERDLLSDPDVSLVLLRPGDLALFHSGALHFASNGADGPSGSLYHGVVASPGLPRLRDAAAAQGGSGGGDAAYAEHLFAADLLELVERRLAGAKLSPRC